MEKVDFVRKPIFRVENCPQIQTLPKNIKVPKIAIFPIKSYIFYQKWIDFGWKCRLVGLNE